MKSVFEYYKDEVRLVVGEEDKEICFLSSFSAYYKLTVSDDKIQELQKFVIGEVRKEQERYAPYDIRQEFLHRLLSIAEEKLVTHAEFKQREEEREKTHLAEEKIRQAEEKLRKEKNLVEWKEGLTRYWQTLKAEFQRITELLQKDFIIENYDEIRDGYHKQQYHFDDDDC